MRFKKVSRVEEDIRLPERSTKHSAGYDFFLIEDIEIPPFEAGIKPSMVPTGIKAYLDNDKFLMLTNRSSNPKKHNLVIPMSQGIIDADYYNNPDNEGEMFFAFYNFGTETVKLSKGDKIGQGIIMNYYKVDDDSSTAERSGGFGSTGD